MQLALDEPELSPRELATRFTDTKSYFVSEASVYRLLKEHDLIASPAYIVMKAADQASIDRRRNFELVVSLDRLRGIHDRRTSAHIDRHSHSLHGFVAASALA